MVCQISLILISDDDAITALSSSFYHFREVGDDIENIWVRSTDWSETPACAEADALYQGEDTRALLHFSNDTGCVAAIRAMCWRAIATDKLAYAASISLKNLKRFPLRSTLRRLMLSARLTAYTYISLTDRARFQPRHHWSQFWYWSMDDSFLDGIIACILIFQSIIYI